ncbi:MAG: metallophosphoesterase family protein [Acidobacteria bacterium]|nr:metallophosphoesterase family protein [Candidatus Sulfomarinibacter sp. MAG AM1]
MRYLILSDIHANWVALQAVKAHVRRKRFDRVVFLGDAVGYGASPNQVLTWLRSLGPTLDVVRGNHDRVCAGLDSAEYFNRYARQAATWTLDHLEERNLEFLRSFPEGPFGLTDDVAICHGSTVDEDAYIFSAHDAQLAFAGLPHRLILFGHTHVPSLFVLREDNGKQTLKVRLLSGRRIVLDLDPDRRYLINPGSVGQPRDRDPRAAYAILDTDQRRIYLYRIAYSASVARRRILGAGLPPVLGDRLLYGA